MSNFGPLSDPQREGVGPAREQGATLDVRLMRLLSRAGVG